MSLSRGGGPHAVSVHSGQDTKVRGVGDASMEDQHLLINHGRQRQPAENLLQQLQDPLAVNLRNKNKPKTKKKGVIYLRLCYLSL